jgi:hypothetical protein
MDLEKYVEKKKSDVMVGLEEEKTQKAEAQVMEVRKKPSKVDTYTKPMSQTSEKEYIAQSPMIFADLISPSVLNPAQ